MVNVLIKFDKFWIIYRLCKNSAYTYLSPTATHAHTHTHTSTKWTIKWTINADINHFPLFSWWNTTGPVRKLGFPSFCFHNAIKITKENISKGTFVVAIEEDVSWVWGCGPTLTRKHPRFAIRGGRGYPARTILSHDWRNHGNADRWHIMTVEI